MQSGTGRRSRAASAALASHGDRNRTVPRSPRRPHRRIDRRDPSRGRRRWARTRDRGADACTAHALPSHDPSRCADPPSRRCIGAPAQHRGLHGRGHARRQRRVAHRAPLPGMCGCHRVSGVVPRGARTVPRRARRRRSRRTDRAPPEWRHPLRLPHRGAHAVAARRARASLARRGLSAVGSAARA